MIIVADSGSTKTDWVVIANHQKIAFNSKGINPLFLDKDDVIDDISNNFPTNISVKDVEFIFFYGPGCSTDARSKIVEEVLKSVFINAEILVESDLLGAARSLFQKGEGIACILGTGSNSGVYKNNEIVENIPSTGFILGDEGSGAQMGLELIKKYINQQLENSVYVKFDKKYSLPLEDVIDKVYKQAYPNRFLASFAPFLSQNIQEESIRKIVERSIDDFFVLHILPYKQVQNLEVSFVGSVAYNFRTIIEDLAKKYKLKLGKISQKPIFDLVKYHTQTND